MTFLLTVISFTSGAIPFSLLLGKLAGKGDIRRYGDHNPGGTNVLRAAGWGWGLAALILDGLKAAIPVGVGWFGLGWQDARIVPVALAALLGHAYSPFLKGQGGKAVASTFGVWAGLTLGVGPTVLGLLLGLMFSVFASSAWAVMLTMLSFGVFVLTYYAPTQPVLAAVWLGNLALLAWKHRNELKTWPGLRVRLRKVDGAISERQVDKKAGRPQQ